MSKSKGRSQPCKRCATKGSREPRTSNRPSLAFKLTQDILQQLELPQKKRSRRKLLKDLKGSYQQLSKAERAAVHLEELEGS